MRLIGLALEALLISLICIGFWLRFRWNDWSQGANLHPDEYGLANTLTQLNLPRSAVEYFNTRLSPLSPYQKYDLNGQPTAAGADNRMRWGHLPILIIRFAAERTGLTGYGELIRLGRRLSALTDCLSLILLCLIGRRLYGRRIALLATTLSALTVLQIQQSHFMTVDAFAVLFSLFAMYCAVRAAERGGAKWSARSDAKPQLERHSQGAADDWKWYALFGVAAGMAVASRINLILILGVIPISAVIGASGEWRQRAPEHNRIFVGTVVRIVLAAVVALVVFRVMQPAAFREESGETTLFTVRPNPDWVESMKLAAAESDLDAGGPPAEQWTGRRRLIFPLVNMVVWGMGLPLGIAACGGFAWASWRLLYADDWRTDVLPLAWSSMYFVFMGTRHVMSMRYFLPIYPFLALLAARALAELWEKSAATAPATDAPPDSGKSRPRLKRFAAAAVAAIVVLGTLLWVLAFTCVYRQPNTRIDASRWIYENVAAGATITNESWDESLPVPLDGRDPFGGLYRGLTMEVRWPDSEAKRRMLLANLDACNYVVLSSQRALWSISRLPNTYPMTMEYYRALFDGRLGFELAAQFQRPFRIGQFHISDLVGKLAWRRDPPVPVSNAEPFNESLLGAEEAFSVYDHAPVWVFRKRADFDLSRAGDILRSVDLSRVVVQGPREATAAPTRLMLPLDRLTEQRAGGTWSEMFNPESILNRHHIIGVAAWYGTLLFMGWLAFPLTFLALNGLPDRGYPLSKTLAMLLVAWIVWIAGSYRFLPTTRPTILLAILIISVLSYTVLHRRRAELVNYLRSNLRYVLLVEVLFLVLFVGLLMIRLGNPDLWHPFFGGEKPMVFSYFNAVLKSSSFPPYDPWLAGGYINYYYYGFVVVGQMVKLLGLVPSFAYNLILPTLFGLLGTTVFCIAYNLVKPRTDRGRLAAEYPLTRTVAGSEPPRSVEVRANGDRPGGGSHRLANPYLAGIASCLLATVLGNLAQVKILAAVFQRATGRPVQAPGDLDWSAVITGAGRVLFGEAEIPVRLGNWYWDASRTVAASTGGNEINEFPFFTFLYGDMHAHMMGMPIVILFLAWAVSYVVDTRKRSRLESAAVWFVGALALGATRITNMWDFPTCLALGCVAIFAARRWHDPNLTRASLAPLAGRLLLFAGLTFLLYRPFDRWFVSPLAGLKLWNGAKTPLEPYLSIHGLFLFVLATWLLRETRQWLDETPASVLSHPAKWLAPVLLGVCGFSICSGLLLAGRVTTALVAMPIILWSGLLLLRSRARIGSEKRSTLFLLGTGFALTLFVELFAIGGDRTNTFFKLYLQAWLLLAVATGPALAWVWADKASWTPRWNRAWTGGLLLLAAMAALYPATATWAKVLDRFPSATVSVDGDPASDCKMIPGIPGVHAQDCCMPVGCQPCGLDGLAYMQCSAYCDNGYFLPLKYDYEAIRWMQRHIAGSPVIAEAQSFNLYRMSSRYSWNTGLPNVVGWDWHERQQRAAISTDFITDRGYEVTRFFADPDLDQAAAFMREYGVRYIIVGPMERAYYSASGGLQKFQTMVAQGFLFEVYKNPGVVIYQASEQK